MLFRFWVFPDCAFLDISKMLQFIAFLSNVGLSARKCILALPGELTGYRCTKDYVWSVLAAVCFHKIHKYAAPAY